MGVVLSHGDLEVDLARAATTVFTTAIASYEPLLPTLLTGLAAGLGRDVLGM